MLIFCEYDLIPACFNFACNSSALLLLATAATCKPARRKPFFVVTIRCCDGARERLKIYYNQRGLHPGATAAAKKIAAVLTHYRPAQP